MAAPNDDKSLALYCDFENIALGVRDAKYQKFDIHHILERLLVKGSIVVKKAYCDWDRYKNFKGPMHEAAFELIEIPHVRMSGKNSADIRMVVDALDLCYTKSHVDTFVIISGDSDFSPLVSKLRENAKTVIGVGVKNSTSDLLISSCDEFIYYDDLVRELEKKRTPERKKRASKKRASRSSRDDAAQARVEEPAGTALDDGSRTAGRTGTGADGSEARVVSIEEASRAGSAADAPAADTASADTSSADTSPAEEPAADAPASDDPSSAGPAGIVTPGRRRAPARKKKAAAAAADVAEPDDAPAGDGAPAGDDTDAATTADGAGAARSKTASRARRGSRRAKSDASVEAAGDESADTADETVKADKRGKGRRGDKGAADERASAASPEVSGPAETTTASSLAAVSDIADGAPVDEAANESRDADESTDLPDTSDEDGKPEELAQEGLDIVLETALALSSERGGSDKLWGSMVKQTLKRRRPGFSESYYGYDSFRGMLEDAESRGYLALEHDDRSGGYIITRITV